MDPKRASLINGTCEVRRTLMRATLRHEGDPDDGLRVHQGLNLRKNPVSRGHVRNLGDDDTGTALALFDLSESESTRMHTARSCSVLLTVAKISARISTSAWG